MPYPNKHDPLLQYKLSYLQKRDRVIDPNDYYENMCMNAVNQSIGSAVRRRSSLPQRSRTRNSSPRRLREHSSLGRALRPASHSRKAARLDRREGSCDGVYPERPHRHQGFLYLYSLGTHCAPCPLRRLLQITGVLCGACAGIPLSSFSLPCASLTP